MQKVKIGEVKPNPNNPRKLDKDKFAKLVQSIKDFPEMLEKRPIVIADGIILGGNMRHKAAVEAGLKEIPIIDASEWTDKQKEQFIIKDNVSFGEWDWDILANEWDAADLNDWGLYAPVIEDIEVGAFDDEGIDSKSQFGVIVMCEGESHQREVFDNLQRLGYAVKVVTT